MKMYNEEVFKMAKDKEWEIGVLLSLYSYSFKAGNLSYENQEKYERAVSLTMAAIGIVYPIEDFMEDVKNGYYIDWDGSANALDYEGNELDIPVNCDLEVLEKAKEKGVVFIEWCNK